MRRLLVVLAACDTYAHVSLHNAPGVVDLATPSAHENGDPARYDPPAPAEQATVAVFPMPYFTGGVGRNGSATETGLEMRFERTVSDQGALLSPQTFAITAGAGVVWHDGVASFGPVYAELDYRFLAGEVFPLDLGLGPAAYTSNFELGGQLTVRIPLLLTLVRFRYLPASRFEVLVGAELPFALFFGRSR